MSSNIDEYRKLCADARLSTADKSLRQGVVTRLAGYVVAELRRLGWEDGELCYWSGVDGFDGYRAEANRRMQRGGFRNLTAQISKVEDLAGIPRKRPTATSGLSGVTISLGGPSALLAKALREAVLASTIDFRKPQIEAEKGRREQEAAQRALREKENRDRGYVKPEKNPGGWVTPRPWV